MRATAFPCVGIGLQLGFEIDVGFFGGFATRLESLDQRGGIRDLCRKCIALKLQKDDIGMENPDFLLHAPQPLALDLILAHGVT